MLISQILLDQFTHGLLSERKFSWPHFGIAILGAGKYDYLISHSKNP
jgi:hypothetical protein